LPGLSALNDGHRGLDMVATSATSVGTILVVDARQLAEVRDVPRSGSSPFMYLRDGAASAAHPPFASR
jgi:hypothetical protein